ncbi:MAG TPA: outer membrane protein assembly factor BamA [Gemmatimonadaceae bacterium]|jgi:outer membrane protein insertion porin family|nr:outer membrane protein assembly factor BamA [Gemmatimonadaceae bacterium]
MRRLTLALLAAAATASTASAQGAASGGACTQPDSVEFRGNTRLGDNILRADAGLTAGVAVNYRVIQRAIKALYGTGQFDDVRAVCEPRPAGRAVLVFLVSERPMLLDVNVEGAQKVSPGDVRDQVGLLVGRPVDPAEVARTIVKIDSLYETKGYAFARVKAETTFVDSGSARILFSVDEGRRTAVSGIRVTGNQKLSAKAIVGAMQTQPEGFFFWHKGELDQQTLARDVGERVPGIYGDHGFIDAQVVHDTTELDRAVGKALVGLQVKEGEQYHVGEFSVQGARQFSSQQIEQMYPFGDHSRTLMQAVKDALHVGVTQDQTIFNQSAWQDATTHVQDAYANSGYIYAQVNPVVERTMSADSTPVVNLRWDIYEGTPAVINRVNIIGNDVTNETCIRRQVVVVPGDVFNKDLLLQSYQNIANLGFFETPLPEPQVTQSDDKGDVDITFQVKEKRTGNVNFGASVGQGTGLGGFIGFAQPNLFGRCKQGSVQWQKGRYINDFTATYTDPAILQSRYSGTLSAYHSQSRFLIQNIGQSTTTGGQIQLGMPVFGSRYTRFFVNYGGESVRYGNDGLVGTIQQCTDAAGRATSCFRSTVGMTLDHDTRLGMPFPTSGVHQTVNAQFNGGPLGGTASYQRYTGQMQAYATLGTIGGSGIGSAPMFVVGGLKTNWGALFGNPGPFFVSQSFAMGGVQYGEPLRGYDEFSITPTGYNPQTTQYQAQRGSFGNAFFSATAELGLRINSQIYLDAFYDAGNVYAQPRDFDPTRLFRGVGFGASIITPLGPLGVDLGYGLDRVDALGRKDPQWKVHFKFGQFFQ